MYHLRKPKFIFNKCILCGIEDSVEHILEFCMGINDQRVALVTSVNIFLNSNDFNSLIMKDRCLFILTNVGYNEITEWEPFGGIVDKGILEIMMIKCEAIGKL